MKGIGEKTASELIQKFGSFEKLYHAIDKGLKSIEELKPSVQKNLVEYREDAEMAKKLVTILRDVPIDFSLEECTYIQVTRETLTELFEDLEFHRLLNHLPSDTESDKEVAAKNNKKEKNGTASLFTKGHKNEVESSTVLGSRLEAAEFEKVLNQIHTSRHIALRTIVEEHDPVNPKIIAIGIAERQKTFIVTGELLETSMGIIENFIATYKGDMVFHDYKNELNVLPSLKKSSAGVFDLMIASYLLHSGERRSTLEIILSSYRNVPKPEKFQDDTDRFRRLEEELLHFVSLADELEQELSFHKLAKLNEDIELPVAKVLAHMENTGVNISKSHFKLLSTKLGKRIVILTKKIHKVAGEEFNINSPMQLRVILFEKLGISPVGLKKTQKNRTLSTAASELEKLRGENKIIDLILEYRELTKLKSTYVDAIPPLVNRKSKRIHANFNQAVTATGRLSSSNPNLQNIPTTESEYGKAVRDGFVASKGYVLLAADYSQIELRLVAHIAKEKTMISAFEKGEDIHYSTAVAMFGEAHAKEKRRIAKVINFGILYGMGPQRLADSAGISFMEAREYIETYFSIHKGIQKYMDSIREKIATVGYVETMFGRKRFFHNFDVMNRREQAEAERQAINMPLQGTQADMIKIAMIKIDEYIDVTYGSDKHSDVRMIIQVHDELIFEIKEEKVKEFSEVLSLLMSNVVKLSVPVVVNFSTGKKWGSLKKFEVLPR